MDEIQTTCPVCGTPATKTRSTADETHFTCPIDGAFIATDSAVAVMEKREPVDRMRMLETARGKAKLGEKPRIIADYL